jgi:hypothetical protein
MAHDKFKASSAAALLCASCTTMPEFQVTQNGKTVRDIFSRVQCEIQQAARKHKRLGAEGWVATASLTLTVMESGHLSPSLRYLNAIPGGSFALSGSLALSSKNTRIYTQSFTVALQSTMDALADTCREDAKTNFDMSGNLGIVETATLGLTAIDDKPHIKFGTSKTDAFGQTITFVITKGLDDLGPTWAVQHFVGPGGFAGVAREDTHQLQLAFTLPDKPAVAPKPGPGKKQPPAPPPSMINDARDKAQQLFIQQQLQLDQRRR